MPGKGFCAKNMAVIIAMSDILQLQDGYRIQIYKFPKIKNRAKTGRKFTKCKCGAPIANPCGAPFEKRCYRLLNHTGNPTKIILKGKENIFDCLVSN